jgi:hypothetical protein
MEKLEHSNIANKNHAATLENCMAVPKNIEHGLTIWPRNSTPKTYTPKNQKHIAMVWIWSVLHSLLC